jgi:hypothetical protein
MKVRQYIQVKNFDASKQASFDVAQVDNDNVTFLNLREAHSISMPVNLYIYPYHFILFIYLSSYLCIYLFIHSFIYSSQFVRLLIST